MIARKSSKRRRPVAIAVDEDQRRHLIEDCAFFRAEHYREARPGEVRELDRQAVAADIDAALGARRGRRRKR